MGRIYSNGPAKDYVFNPFTIFAAKATQLSIAAPFVTVTDDLVQAARRGCRIELIVGLNAATSPKALYAVQKEPSIQVRYYSHRRFHAKIYILGDVAMIGSSNLTDGGLQSNREATIVFGDSEDSEAFQELRAVFADLWEYAAVLTDDVLKRFAQAREKYKPSTEVDDLIGNAIGKVEPPNINVASRRRTADRIYLESLRRQVSEYRNAFNEVTKILEENRLQRAELDGCGAANQTNRFLSWIRSKHAPTNTWEAAPIRSQEGRRERIIELGNEWLMPESDPIDENFVPQLRVLQTTFGNANEIGISTKDELTNGLKAIHAFSDRRRFMSASVDEVFWSENKDDLAKVRTTLTYLVQGGGDFAERLHDVLYKSQMKLRGFGPACALELFGTIKPHEYPPVNGRITKALRFLGFDVHQL
jgi:PLD-like domain